MLGGDWEDDVTIWWRLGSDVDVCCGWGGRLDCVHRSFTMYRDCNMNVMETLRSLS